MRAAVSWDVRQQTQYGTLRTYIRLGIQQTTPADPQAGAVFWDRAFMQFAGFTVGKAQSFYDTVTYGGAYSYHNVRTVSDTGASGWNVWAYTAQFGNGFSATLSLEDPNRNKTVVDGSVGAAFAIPAALTGNDPAFNAQSATNNGFRMPDVIGNLRVDQAWGYAAASVAIHDASGGYWNGNPGNVNNGHPADKLGWAASAGVSFALAGGDRLAFNGQYSVGASGYGAAIGQLWTILSPGKSIGLGWATDGVFDTGREIELTTVWNVIAFYEHIWNPNWRTSIYGGYVKVDYNANATNIINSHLPGAAGTNVCGVPVGGAVWPNIPLPAGGGGNSCNPDFSFYQVGTRTQWNPVPQLDIGLDLLYTRLNTAYKGATLAGGVAPGAPQNPVTFIDDQNVFSAYFRWQRNFYP